MIERIKKIKNIGTYESAGVPRIVLNSFTYIYACNAYGKSTFCDIIRSLKNNDVSIVHNRRRVGCSETAKCEAELTINGGNAIYTENGWIIDSTADIREHIHIFDTNFVNDNVFTNFNIEHKNKENLTSFILGDRGVELIKKLERYETEQSQKEQRFKELKYSLEKSLNGSDFDEIKKIGYIDTFKDIESIIISLAEGVKSFQKQKTEIDNIKALKGMEQLNTNPSNLCALIQEIKEFVSIPHKIDLTSVKEKICAIKTEYSMITDDWLKNGVKILSNKDFCPICGNSISDNAQVKTLSLYYSEEFIKIIDEIEALEKRIDKTIKEFTEGNIVAKIIQSATRNLSYCDVSIIEKEEFSSILEKIRDLIEEANQNIVKVKQELNLVLKKKLASITDTVFTFDESNGLLQKIEELMDYQKVLNNKIENFNKLFYSYQESLSEEFLEQKIFEAEKEIKIKKLIFQRGVYNEQIEELKQLESHIKELKQKIKETRTTIDIEQEDFLNKYFATIQNIFSKLGSSDYTIEREIVSRGKRKVYGVKIKFKGVIVEDIKYCLSESDRRALALSIFLAKIKIDCDKKSVIVLDDPITSFDENRIRLFLNIIDELKIKSFSQIIILMHYENLLKAAVKMGNEKTILKIEHSMNNHNFVEIFEDDALFKNEYEQKIDKIIKFINAEINDISENEVRIYYEKFLHYYFAYAISNDNDFKGKRLHDFITELNRKALISLEKRDDLLFKLKFLNDSSHDFTEYTEEEKRSFVKEAYESLHTL